MNCSIADMKAMSKSFEKPAIAHFIRSYLSVTQNWIYTQLIDMKLFKPFVLTKDLINLDQFPFEDIFCHRPPFSGSHLLQIASKKLLEAISRSHENYCTDLIRTKRTKLLHAHFGTEGWYHLGVQRKVDLPLITTFYGDDMSRLPRIRPIWKKRYKKLFEAGTLFLAEGPYMAQSLADLGCPPDKVRVQHLGVDVQHIHFIPRHLQKGETVRILMACSFREKKGIHYGVRAFAQAARKHSNIEMRIVGGAKTDDEKQLMVACQTIAKNEGVADKISFLGYIPYSRYLHEIANAHIFLAPSIRAADGDTEGGAPVAVIEASAAGMPVIATWHCDIPNVVVNGETGLLVPERNVKALTEAILYMVSSPEIWYVFGTKGRVRVENEFNALKQVQRLENIYRELAKCSG